MKTYLKHPYEKPLTKVFYTSSDSPDNFPSRVDYRQRIVQPSTKEQQRLLSNSHSPRLQHVHYGKYGIKPIWPSDESVCKLWEQGRKSSKNRWSSFASLSSKSDRNQCVRSKSDSEKKLILPSRSTLSYVIQEDGSKLMLASFSLFLLLLIIYIFYRRRCIKINETKLDEQRRRRSLEESLLKQEPIECHLPSTRKLPTIIEESPATLSPLNSSNKFLSIPNSTNIQPSATVTDDNDSRNLLSTTSRQQKPSASNLDKIEKTVQKVSPSKEQQPVVSDQPPHLQQTTSKLPAKVEEPTVSTPPLKEEQLVSTKVTSKEQPTPLNPPSKSEQLTTPKLAPKDESATITSPSKVEQSAAPKSKPKEQPVVPSPPAKSEPSTTSKPTSKEQATTANPPTKVEEAKIEKSKIDQSKAQQPGVPKPIPKEQSTPSNVPSKSESTKTSKEIPKEQSAPSNVPSKSEQTKTSKEIPKAEPVAASLPSTVVEQSTTSNQRRRSRFENDSKDSTKESTVVENLSSPPVVMRKDSMTHENVIRDDFTSIEEINNAVKEVGLVHSQLIFGIDYTISNLETGKDSFRGLSLHHIQEGMLNPYQNVISIIGRTLEKYDADSLIPAFGFGDRSTLDRKIFPLRPDGSYCRGFRGVLEAYNEITPKVRMSGPTNFAPLIREAIRIVKKTGEYHILVIVADGQVTNERQTKDAIVEASNYPLSIVMIGVGDGPWDMMEEFDDSLPTRQFDNFQFVEYNKVVEASTNTDSSFALRALMEIPAQYAAIKNLGLLDKKD